MQRASYHKSKVRLPNWHHSTPPSPLGYTFSTHFPFHWVLPTCAILSLSLLSSLLNYPLSRISHIHRYATQFPHYIHIRVHAHPVCPACRNFGLRLSLLSTCRFSRPRTSPVAAAAKSVLASSSVHSVRGGSKGIGSYRLRRAPWHDNRVMKLDQLHSNSSTLSSLHEFNVRNDLLLCTIS